MRPFEKTSEDYRRAKQWLKDTQQYHRLHAYLLKNKDTDGFAVVDLANRILKEDYPNQ